MKHDSRTSVLFDGRNIDQNTFYSLVNFTIRDQVTIHAVNMQPDDQVTFEVLYLKSGTMPEACGCYIQPGDMPATVGSSLLMCDQCDEETGLKTPVRLTAENPVVILDAPQGVILRGVYEGDGIEQAIVWAVTSTETQDLTPGMRGCPAICCVPDPDSWQPTGNRTCDVDNDVLLVQYIDNCGNTEWRDEGQLVWEATGQVVCSRDWDHEAGEPGSTRVEQVNICGQTRWVDGDPQRWVDTGAVRCVTGPAEGDDPVEEYTERQVVNDCGDLDWIRDEDIAWVDTGVTRCENNIVQRQQVNPCGRLRWSDTDESCGYLATYPLPCGGLAFRPDDNRDPEATVEIRNCDDELVAYIYPTPRPGAITPVHQGCEGCGGELMGFAVNGSIDWKCDKPTQVEVRSISRQAVQYFSLNGRHYVLWSDGKARPLTI